MAATLVNDYAPLFILIESAQSQGDHVIYNVKVQRGHTQEESWVVRRRYSDFTALDAELKISGVELPLPPKKVFGNTSREFIAERQQKLQAYLNTVLSYHLLANSVYTKRLLYDDLYHDNLQELALQQISMFLRSEPEWEVVEPLPHIGCRLRKCYFLVKNTRAPKERFLLTWCSLGPFTNILEKDRIALLKTFSTLQHPYLAPIKFCSGNQAGAIIIRSFDEKGSLRDHLCKTKPKVHYLKKYGAPKAVSPLTISEIKTYGRQILEFIKYMKEKNFPLGHVHCGNVLIQEGKVQITDIENFILGVPPAYRTPITHHRKCNTLDMMDIYGFGQMLFEMAHGLPLNSSHCEMLPPTCPPEIAPLIDRLLKTESIKAGLPFVDDLILSPFFSGTSISISTKPAIKIPSKLKDCLKHCREQYEQSITEEQRTIHHLRQRTKIRAHQLSEGEKSKRKQNQKLQKARELGNSSPSLDSRALENNNNNKRPHSQPQISPAGLQSSPNTSVPPPPAAPAPPSAALLPSPAVPPPPQSASKVPQNVSSPEAPRSALLSSITGFSKKALKRTETIDKSAPKL